MAGYVIRAGDVKVFNIDGTEFPVPEGVEFQIVATNGTKPPRSNETTTCHENTVIIKGTQQKAGIFGIKIALASEVEKKFNWLRDESQAFKCLLTLANDDTYYGDNMSFNGEPKMSSVDKTVEVDVVGSYFYKM